MPLRQELAGIFHGGTLFHSGKFAASRGTGEGGSVPATPIKNPLSSFYAEPTDGATALMVRASSHGARSAEGKYPLLFSSFLPPVEPLNWIASKPIGKGRRRWMEWVAQKAKFSSGRTRASRLVFNKARSFHKSCTAVDVVTRWCQAIKGRYSTYHSVN